MSCRRNWRRIYEIKLLHSTRRNLATKLTFVYNRFVLQMVDRKGKEENSLQAGKDA